MTLRSLVRNHTDRAVCVAHTSAVEVTQHTLRAFLWEIYAHHEGTPAQ